ncbi:hypothetical protein EIP86_000937 [Pleurotus ostreatoroseus]|nr:hypothetical protein EIP86_000937 [Pleurotus ostreatoroseus]
MAEVFKSRPAAGGTNAVIADVINTLNKDNPSPTSQNGKGKGKMPVRDANAIQDFTGEVVAAHVYPADCPNLISAMKSIICGFIDKSGSDDEEGLFPPSVRRKAATSLASYDVNLLNAWYSALVQLRGRETVEEIVRRTFFDVAFDPSVALGAEVLEFLADFSARHTPLLDATLSILQIAHLKHFEEPLTVLVLDSKLGQGQTQRGQKHILHQPENFRFLDELLSQLQTQASPTGASSLTNGLTWNDASVEKLVQKIDEARELFRLRSRQMRLGYQVFTCVLQSLKDQGIAFNVPNARPETPMQFMARFVGGEQVIRRDLKHLALVVKKLSRGQLEHVLSQLYVLFYNLPPALRRNETSPREFITQIRGKLEGPVESVDRDSASAVSEWLKTYIEKRAIRLDGGFLWQVWSTVSTPFPSELFNPAPRMTVINALLHPTEIVQEYKKLFPDTGEESETDVDTQEDSESRVTPAQELWNLPDTSILFRRYMDAGKMINVYDWYESFTVELDRQRREDAIRAAAEAEAEASRANGRGREEEAEKWELETHARFIRALHELDFMGFIKHTGRKADHVVRTVYDIPD